MTKAEKPSPFANLLSKRRLGCHPHCMGASVPLSDISGRSQKNGSRGGAGGSTLWGSMRSSSAHRICDHTHQAPGQFCATRFPDITVQRSDGREAPLLLQPFATRGS